MSTLVSSPVFHLYAVSSAALVVLLYGLGFLTGKTRELRKAVEITFARTDIDQHADQGTPTSAGPSSARHDLRWLETHLAERSFPPRPAHRESAPSAVALTPPPAGQVLVEATFS